MYIVAKFRGSIAHLLRTNQLSLELKDIVQKADNFANWQERKYSQNLINQNSIVHIIK